MPIKLQTPVDCGRSRFGISYKDRILVIGSCFADNVGQKMADMGFDVCSNPFGTLYNPVSVANSLMRLACNIPFTAPDCVEMGAGAGLVCSFSHHTSFARVTAEEFLDNANARLSEAAEFFRTCNKVIVTLGTSWCYKKVSDGEVVSNCLKRNASEFVRERLSAQTTSGILSNMLRRLAVRTSVSNETEQEELERKFIFTVSPIRHLRDGAHANQLSKSALLMAEDEVCSQYPANAEYFPAFEIVMDELRDYRFYADDMLHPSPAAVSYIWERFCDFALSDEDRSLLQENEKRYRSSRHRSILHTV